MKLTTFHILYKPLNHRLTLHSTHDLALFTPLPVYTTVCPHQDYSQIIGQSRGALVLIHRRTQLL